MSKLRRRMTMGAVALVAILGGVAVLSHFVWNPGVLEEIRRDPEGARAAKVMGIELPGGKRIPVNYLREGDKVFAGADGPWWRTLRDGGNVVVEIRGQQLRGRGVIVDDNPEYKREVFDRLRPTVPRWLPSWLDAKLVVITLESASADEDGGTSTRDDTVGEPHP